MQDISCFWGGLVNEIKETPCEKYSTDDTKTDVIKQKKRTYLAHHPGIYLTKRETECMTHLIEGKTIKLTAESLGLSDRTVEYYLNNIKAKLQCRTKNELVSRLKNDLQSVH